MQVSEHTDPSEASRSWRLSRAFHKPLAYAYRLSQAPPPLAHWSHQERLTCRIDNGSLVAYTTAHSPHKFAVDISDLTIGLGDLRLNTVAWRYLL